MRYPDHLEYEGIGPTRLAYLDHGQGLPVLMLHGFTFNAWSFRHQIPVLVDAGFRPIIPDHPGFGRTRLAGGFGARAEDYATLYARLLDRLGIPGPIPVAGHSLGGGMALFLAGHHPSLVSSLFLIAPAAEPSSKALRVARVSSKDGFDEVAPVFFTRERLREMARSAYARNVPSDGVIDGYVEGVDVLEAFGIVRTFFSRTFRSLPARYGQMDMPTLVVVGDQDPHDGPAMARRCVEEIPGARTEVLPGVGHCPHEEAPEDLNVLLTEFLQ